MDNRKINKVDHSTSFSFGQKKETVGENYSITRPGFFTPFNSNVVNLHFSGAVYNTFGATINDVRDVGYTLLSVCHHILDASAALGNGKFSHAMNRTADAITDGGKAICQSIDTAFNFAFELIAFITRTIATLLTTVLMLAKAAGDGVARTATALSDKMGTMISRAPKNGEAKVVPSVPFTVPSFIEVLASAPALPLTPAPAPAPAPAAAAAPAAPGM